MFNPLHSVLEYQISYFPSLMSFRQLHFTAYIHDGGPAGSALKHLSTCFGLLPGKIVNFEALELPVDLLLGFRTSVCPSFGEHYSFLAFKASCLVVLSRVLLRIFRLPSQSEPMLC